MVNMGFYLKESWEEGACGKCWWYMEIGQIFFNKGVGEVRW